MNPGTINRLHSIESSLDCLLDANERSGLIIREMMLEAQLDSSVNNSIFTAVIITLLGLFVVKTLWTLRFNQNARIAGTIATVALVGILSVKIPDWPTVSMMNELAELKSDARHPRTNTRCVRGTQR